MTTTKSASLTVLGRLTAVRGFAIFVVLLVVSPVMVGLTAREAYHRVQLPDVGLDVDADLGVESHDARWPGVEQRDRIVALDGEPVSEPAEWVSRSLADDARPLTVTFARGDRQFTRTALPRPLAWADRIAVFARVLTAAVLMAMGLLVFVTRPGTQVTWVMLLLSWVLGAFLLVKIGFWSDPRLVKEATVFPWTLATGLGLHLSSLFPQPIAWFARRRRVLLLYFPVVAAPFIQAFHLVTRASPFGTAITALAMVTVVINVAAQQRRARASGDARSRSQYRALLVGFAVGVLVPAAWNWLRIALDIWNSPWAAHYNALPLTVFVGVTAYAIVRHNALAIDRFTAAIVGYTLTTVLVGGAFAAALVGIPLLLDTSGLGESPGLLVLATALSFAGFAPVHRLIRRWVDRRFFREQAGPSERADALRDLVDGMQGSREDAIAAAFAGAKTLRSAHVELWLLAPDLGKLTCERAEPPGKETAPPIELTGALASALASGVSGGVRELAPRAFDQAAQDELWSHDLALVAPLMARGTLAGFFAVGRKRSGVGYALEEASFLTIIGAQLGAALERLRGETRIDRYHLETRLGTGGMAEVFLAWQVGPGGFERKVALKRPLPHVSEDPNAVAAFLDEARLAAQLVHPHIARVYDVGESAGTYFIVMEYVDGPGLRQVLRAMSEQVVQMPAPIAVAIMTSVLSALEHAHHAGDERGRALELVHRDVSPRNILLSKLGQAKLVDFGIARAHFQLHVTRTGVVKGTLPYMSPEQATDQPIDHRSDLYAAGAVLYELLTGEPAFPKGPAPRPPRPASTIAPDVPPALDKVLARACEPVAAQRYASAAAFADALVAALEPRVPASADEVTAFLRQILPQQMGGAPVRPDDSPLDVSGPQTVIEVPFGSAAPKS